MANDGLHLIAKLGTAKAKALKAPSGRWYLVGRVPVRAGYERKDGTPLTDSDIEAITHCGPGFARACRTRTYETEAEALAIATHEEDEC